MIKHALVAFGIASLASLAGATNVWIGGPLGASTGQSGIRTATIKAVRVQNSFNQAIFSINESNTAVPADRMWTLPLSTDADYAMLTAIFTAFEMGTPVQFLETTVAPNSGNLQYYFTNFTAGEMH